MSRGPSRLDRHEKLDEVLAQEKIFPAGRLTFGSGKAAPGTGPVGVRPLGSVLSAGGAIILLIGGRARNAPGVLGGGTPYPPLPDSRRGNC